MKFVALLLAASLILLAVRLTVFAIASGARALAARRADHAPWTLLEYPEGTKLVLYADRPGPARLRVGAVPFAADDFDTRLYELRAVAADKVRALNNGE